MIAAVYARKSTEQNGIADESKSCARQITHAKAYALRKGWVVADEHVYADDGISGAEFATRPGFLRLMNALKPRPAFQVLIMSEESRLGREAIEIAYALKQLTQAGVHVWLYLEDRQRTLDSPTDKLLMSVTTFADELEREKARQRTYDAMVRKARSQHVTGGVVFGYDNVEVFAEAAGPDGRRQRLHVERVVNPEESVIVRRIFELCAAGKGVRTIAITLNDEGALAPVPRRTGRQRSWAPSTVREILYRPLYRGEVVWNKVKKRDQWGLKKYLARPESEWLRIDAPALRIVSDELWDIAHARLAASRQAYLRYNTGRLWGRPANGVESKYILTGLAGCARCGGGLVVRSRDYGNRRRFAYLCSYYHHRGASACANGLEAPMEIANREVLSTVEADLLRPEVVDSAIVKAVDLLRPSDESFEAQRAEFRAALARLDEELERLAAAVAQGGGRLTPRGAPEADDLRLQLAALEGRRRLASLDVKRLASQARECLTDWQGLLGRQPQQTRQILAELLVGRLIFTPKTDGSVPYYDFAGQGSLTKLLTGVVFPKDRPQAVVTPAGFEPAISTLKGSRPGPG